MFDAFMPVLRCLVHTSVPTVNMKTHLTKVRIGVGTQTERTRT